MIESDTIKLLRECDAGIRMGVSSIDDVREHVQSPELRRCLEHCRKEHEALQEQVSGLLEKYSDEGKAPNPMARGMSWIKTNIMLAAGDPDQTVADLMTDGCNMGVKSLNRYLNQYEAADEYSKDIAKRLIHLEEQLSSQVRSYL